MPPTMPASNPFHDGKTWFYNRNTGEIKHVTNYLQWVYYSGLSWYVRFPTKELAEAYKKAYPPTGKHPFNPTNPANPVGKLGQDAAGSISSVTSDVLKPLFQANIWIRVGQVLLGVVLIAVGVARLTNVVPAATRIARAVA